MRKKKSEPQINLLPQEEFDASVAGRVLKWLLGTFRYIVIATEMIVMVAFLSRFWLDARSNDLIDQINQKKAVITSYSNFEKQFRNVQGKLKLFSLYTSADLTLTPSIAGIANSVPTNISLTQVLIEKDKVTISGISKDESSTSQLVNSLTNLNYLQNVSLNSLGKSQMDDNLTFTINANTKERVVNAN